MPNPFDITLANLRDFLDTIVEGGSMSPNERRRIRRDLVELRRVYYAALQTPPLVPA
jgi:polyhydroxyalkanoate synthesis regulator phasin